MAGRRLYLRQCEVDILHRSAQLICPCGGMVDAADLKSAE